MSHRPHILMSVAYLLVPLHWFGWAASGRSICERAWRRAMEVGCHECRQRPRNLIGTLLCGWLADRFRRRRETFIFACSLFTLTWVFMSRHHLAAANGPEPCWPASVRYVHQHDRDHDGAAV